MKNNIYETKDYSIFKRLKANRKIDKKKVNIIKRSIAKVGYVSNPVTLNENMEVIDGQHRIEALKELGLPVEYRIIEGLNIKHCRAMNENPTSWNFSNIVDSYAESGNENYIRFQKLKSMFKDFSYDMIYCIIFKLPATGKMKYDVTRSGGLELSQELFEKAIETLSYICGFKDIQKKVGGRKATFYQVLAWVANHPKTDRRHLMTAMKNNVHDISPASKTESLLRDITEVYNKGLRKSENRIYFETEWKKSKTRKD